MTLSNGEPPATAPDPEAQMEAWQAAADAGLLPEWNTSVEGTPPEPETDEEVTT